MEDIIKEIEKSNKVLLHCHPNPDPDSVGSTLALKHALEKNGKEVTLIQGDSEIPKAFKFPGVETILKKNIGEVDLNLFDLFLILDSSSKDRISQKHSLIFPDSLSTVLIDHHVRGEEFTKTKWIDTTYSSTSHMVYDLLNELKIEIDHDIALNLFMGIYTDTGGFRYGSNVSKALEVASKLSKIAPDYRKTIFEMENSNRKETLIFEGVAFSSIKTFFDEKLAMIAISNKSLVENGIGEDDIMTGYISNKLKSVEGFMVAATLVEEKVGEVKLSMRTRDEEKYDVSKVVLALGGGGHKGAGGALLEMSLEEAIEKVVKTVKEIYNL